jgi:hypothetical protein
MRVKTGLYSGSSGKQAGYLQMQSQNNEADQATAQGNRNPAGSMDDLGPNLVGLAGLDPAQQYLSLTSLAADLENLPPAIQQIALGVCQNVIRYFLRQENGTTKIQDA